MGDRLDAMRKAVAAKKAPPPLRFTCGHPVKPDVPLGPCPDCRPKAPPKRGPKPNGRPDTVYRMPPGTKKELVWDGKWTGTLTVPGCPQVFTERGNSELKCFRGLHRRYVQWLKAQQTAPAPDATAEAPQEAPTDGT